MPIDENDLAKLRAEHGEISHLETKWGDTVVFRVATPEEYTRWQVEAADAQTRPSANRTLVTACCVYPERARLEAILRAKPALLVRFGDRLIELCGAEEDAVRKK